MEQRLCGVPRHGWNSNIKMDFKEIGCEVSTVYRTWPGGAVL